MQAQKHTFVISSLLLLFGAICWAVAGDAKYNGYLFNNLLNREPRAPTEIFPQPNGPFAVVLFNEGSLSTLIGVLYFKAMMNPADGEWKIDDRFWQKGDWVTDVTSFAWGKNGKYLYVGTMNVYGHAGLYKINLWERKSERIFPTDNLLKEAGLYGSSFAIEIVAVDLERSRLVVEITPQDPEDIKKGLKPVRKEIEFQ